MRNHYKAADFSSNRKPVVLAIMLLMMTAVAISSALADQPPFDATITITGDLEIAVNEVTTLTAEWSTNRDVTRCEWSVQLVGRGVQSFDGASSGSSTFDFSSDTAGTFVISFGIWHHRQSGRDASESVTVTVTADPIEDPVVYDYESAFAFGGEGYANDFRENGFSRWGWTNGLLVEGEHYVFELWAAAGQSDFDKGTLVGTVTVDYGGGSLTWTVEVNSPNILENEDGEVEVHVYAGSEMFPRLPNGECTVAPGQYGNTGDTGFIDGLSDGIYVIIHAVVGIPQ